MKMAFLRGLRSLFPLFLHVCLGHSVTTATLMLRLTSAILPSKRGVLAYDSVATLTLSCCIWLACIALDGCKICCCSARW